MRAVIQRVSRASVTVEDEVTGRIGQGLLVLLGITRTDTEQDALKLAEKLVKLRIFMDENGKTNLSIKDVGGSILAVSQFTLCADFRKNRPSFSTAGDPVRASELYDHFCDACARLLEKPTERGVFGAEMKVELENSGPFTVCLETEKGELVYR